MLRKHLISATIVLALFSCTKKENDSNTSSTKAEAITKKPAVYDATIPKDIKWTTAKNIPLIASKDAVKGGTLNDFMLSFPLTLEMLDLIQMDHLEVI